jgi:uncharacterized protein (DUF488 family)
MVRILTVGHGRRPADELVEMLRDSGARTLVDVRRFPGSRRNPQFNRAPLAEAMAEAGITYLHAIELGGRLSGEPGADRFSCIREPAFRSYLARMGRPQWQFALAEALLTSAPAFMCAETPWWRCHRKLIAELLHARGNEVVHLLRPGESQLHRPIPDAEVKEGRLFVCGELVG